MFGVISAALFYLLSSILHSCCLPFSKSTLPPFPLSIIGFLVGGLVRIEIDRRQTDRLVLLSFLHTHIDTVRRSPRLHACASHTLSHPRAHTHTHRYPAPPSYLTQSPKAILSTNISRATAHLHCCFYTSLFRGPISTLHRSLLASSRDRTFLPFCLAFRALSAPSQPNPPLLICPSSAILAASPVVCLPGISRAALRRE